ncbi:MAG: phosphodiesterase [Alphaproteobacteria bacterium]|nr:phosphodiesterase [Alphaproteobacteria bacterium]
MLIAQITDTHIRAQGELCYNRVDTAPYLERVVAALNALRPVPDLVIATGDLTDRTTPEEYARLKGLLAPLKPRLALVVGNHDNRDNLRKAFPEHRYLGSTGFVQYTIEDLPVRAIVLDTLDPGQIGGRLCAERLAWLDARLAEQPKRPTLIALHHPPFRTGIEAMDQFGLIGAEGLADVVGKYRNIERIICGHQHRSVDARFAGTIASIGPATAHQVFLGLGDHGVWGFTMEPSAYRLYWWIAGQGLVSHVGHAAPFDGPYSFKDGAALNPPVAP